MSEGFKSFRLNWASILINMLLETPEPGGPGFFSRSLNILVGLITNLREEIHTRQGLIAVANAAQRKPLYPKCCFLVSPLYILGPLLVIWRWFSFGISNSHFIGKALECTNKDKKKHAKTEVLKLALTYNDVTKTVFIPLQSPIRGGLFHFWGAGLKDYAKNSCSAPY